MTSGPVDKQNDRATAQTLPALTYTPDLQIPLPIPPAERSLQTVVAEPWLTISNKAPGLGALDNNIVLEGPAFDREGNLFFVEVYGGRVMRATPDGELNIVVPKNAFGSAGIGIHKDGRLFVAGVGNMSQDGCVYTVRPDGTDLKMILAPDLGYIPDDLVIDEHGGFYFTDFQGNNADPKGGVFYVGPDMKTVTSIMPNLSMPNGLALSPDGKILWVGETGRNLLHRIELSAPTQIALHGMTVPYHFVAAHADSMRVDADGNVYVALVGGGRVLVFNAKGAPIGQILVPGRDQGKYPYTTSMAIRPGTRELYIVASDADGQEAVICRCGAFAEATTLYSHR